MAVWDASERYLFVGDTAYEKAPILLPLEGNVVEYSQTLVKLQGLVSVWNEEAPQCVQMASGHITCSIDAQGFIAELTASLSEIKTGKAEALGQE